MTIKVYCAGAVQGVMAQLGPRFQEHSGEQLDFTFGAVGALKSKVKAGEAVDFLILSRQALEDLEGEGRVNRSSIAELGRVGVGIAVREDAACPVVATPTDLKQALLDAPSITYGNPAHGDSSGVHFDQVLDSLGIKVQLASRMQLANSGIAAAQLVRQGKAQIGATQASVILTCPGIVLAGMLPSELQRFTTYACAIPNASVSQELTARFAAYLISPAARFAFEAAGMQQ